MKGQLIPKDKKKLNKNNDPLDFEPRKNSLPVPVPVPTPSPLSIQVQNPILVNKILRSDFERSQKRRSKCIFKLLKFDFDRNSS